jgi:hypothetical protein
MQPEHGGDDAHICKKVQSEHSSMPNVDELTNDEIDLVCEAVPSSMPQKSE